MRGAATYLNSTAFLFVCLTCKETGSGSIRVAWRIFCRISGGNLSRNDAVVAAVLTAGALVLSECFFALEAAFAPSLAFDVVSEAGSDVCC
jgi:hypothetical protein